MKRVVAILFVQLLFVSGVCVVAQEKEKAEPQHKMVEFHMALLKRGPNAANNNAPASKLLDEHKAYVFSLLESGKAIIAGPMAREGDLVGIYILRAKGAEEARSWADADPLVKAGHVKAEMHPWWSEEVMKKPATPMKLTTAYLAFLTRGAKWTPEKTPQTEEIQKAHMANITRLAETKKLVVAGPFGDNGTLRGIFVFKVASLEEAKALAETDPAVQAGRLAIEIHPWLVPEGILP